jgi:hypothetical protein
LCPVHRRWNILAGDMHENSHTTAIIQFMDFAHVKRSVAIISSMESDVVIFPWQIEVVVNKSEKILGSVKVSKCVIQTEAGIHIPHCSLYLSHRT